MLRSVRLLIAAIVVLCVFDTAHAIETPGCSGVTTKDCVIKALDAMGGEQKLENVHSIQLDIASHTALMEQSYRQEPFITAYKRSKTTIDFAGHRLRSEIHQEWPEADLNQSGMDITLIATPSGGIYHTAQGDGSCSLTDLDNTNAALALGPSRLLLTALHAPDLHYEAAETLRSTAHTVVAFQWQSIPVHILLNSFNHLPDAVETTAQFHDFWYYWGDVKQRVYWDNWRYVQGIVYPSNEITERNGAVWRSEQVLDIQFNVPTDDKRFAMDVQAAQLSTQQKGWARRFNGGKSTQLAQGIDLYASSWNTTIVQQPDGIVILETPISALYTQGIFNQARKKYPDAKIKAVLSTSDSWPHVGGIRFDVAQGVPVYILDLNEPLLHRMLTSPHTIDPDALQRSREKPDWKIVSDKVEIGSGANRMVLYPLRGASTERQYMVYFPDHRLLYASDTLVVNPDNTLYDPELFHEVQQAVAREHLDVDTVYAMHQSPVPWSEVMSLLKKSS